MSPEKSHVHCKCLLKAVCVAYAWACSCVHEVSIYPREKALTTQYIVYHTCFHVIAQLVLWLLELLSLTTLTMCTQLMPALSMFTCTCTVYMYVSVHKRCEVNVFIALQRNTRKP